MNAVLWQAELTPSVLANRLLNLFSLSVMAGLCFTPWYSGWWVVKPLLMLVVIAEWRGHRDQLARRCGSLALTDQELWIWQQQGWRLTSALSWLPWCVFVRWRCGRQRYSFWLMRDAMDEQSWRQLRFYWLLGRNRQWK